MDSDVRVSSPRNALYNLAALGGLLLGLYLLGAAYGHTAAVWSGLNQSRELGARFMTLLPALTLATTGLINMGVCAGLWSGSRRTAKLALIANVITALYLVFLLNQAIVPDHPIGIFALTVVSYVALLGAILLGLVWPADSHQSTPG